MEAKRKEFEDKNKWNAQRFPDCWLAWYVYGPPKCGGHHLFESSEMQHLTKIKARRTLSEEEEIVELGQANKLARRQLKANRKGKGLVLDNSDDSNSSHFQFPTEFKWIREEKQLTSADELDRAIQSTREMIALLVEMAETDDIVNGNVVQEISVYRKKLKDLLAEKIDDCLHNRAELKRKHQ